MSVDSEFLKSQYNVNNALLRELENTYLVRKEPNSVGGISLEISHDTLIAPMLTMKKERRAKEELEEAKRKEAEAQRLAAIETRRRRIANLLAAAAALGFLLSMITSYWAIRARDAALSSETLATIARTRADLARGQGEIARAQADLAKAGAELAKQKAILSDSTAQIEKRKAELAAKVAIAQTIEAEKSAKDAKDALAKAETEKKQRIANDIAKYIASADRMVAMGKYKVARDILSEALKLDPTNVLVLEKLKSMEGK